MSDRCTVEVGLDEVNCCGVGCVGWEDSLRINNGTVDSSSELGCTVVIGITEGRKYEAVDKGKWNEYNLLFDGQSGLKITINPVSHTCSGVRSPVATPGHMSIFLFLEYQSRLAQLVSNWQNHLHNLEVHMLKDDARS